MKKKTKDTLKKTGLIAGGLAALAGLNYARKYRGFAIKTSFFRKMYNDDGQEVEEWAWEAKPGWIAKGRMYQLWPAYQALEVGRGTAQGPTGAKMAAHAWVDTRYEGDL